MTLNFEWMASAVVAVCIFLATLAFRSRTKAWSHPAVVFSGFWCLMMVLPMVAAPQLSLSPYAFGYVLLAVIAFGLPTFAQEWESPVRVAQARSSISSGNIFASRELLVLFFVLQIAPIIFILVNLEIQGFHLSALANPLKLNCEYLSARYNGHVSTNLAMSSGTLANYVGAPIGGMILANRKGYRLPALILLMSFIPGALNMIAYADKGTIFLTAAYFYGGVIVGRLATGDLRLVTIRTAVGAIAVALFLVPLVSVSMINRNVGASCDSASRGAKVMSAVKSVVAEVASAPQEVLPNPAPIATPVAKHDSDGRLAFYLRSYAVGAQFAFSDWFDHYTFGASSQPYATPSAKTLGRYTFMFAAKKIDKQWAAKIPDGYFDEYFKRDGVLQTNIYTLWRGLITDFSIPGSLVFMALFGTAMSFGYRKMLLQEHNALAQSAYVFFAGFTYSSSLISLLTWNSPFAAFFVLAAILFGAHWRLKAYVKTDRPRDNLRGGDSSPADVRDFLPGRTK